MPDSELPNFDNPPVVEVAIGVHFTRLAGLTAAHVGLFWSRVQERFPTVEQQPPIGATIENEQGALSQPGLIIQIANAPILPRTQFIDPRRTEMLQIQSDMLFHNWRRTESPSTEYPRYPRIREGFVADLTDFRTFLADSNLGDIGVQQAEISYINHIAADDNWRSHADLAAVFKPFAGFQVAQTTQPAEDVQMHMRMKLLDAGGRFSGRLHIEIQPAFRLPGMEPLFVLTLTARGAPEGRDVDQVMAFLDAGRRAIVTTFRDLTTDEMHAVWRLR